MVTRRRKRFASQNQKRNSLGWAATAAVAEFDTATVAQILLVSDTDFITGGAGVSYVNLKRLIFDFSVRPSDGFLLGVGTAQFFYEFFWAVFVQDETDQDLLDPISPNSLQEQVTLAHGMGSIVGFQNATGNDLHIGSSGCWRHIDVKSNRRLKETETCFFSITAVNGNGAGVAESVQVRLSARSLITTGIRTS